MTALSYGPPLTVIYRGTLEDTAVLVGLAFARANVGLIAFTGDVTDGFKNYCEVLNRWLKSKNMPKVAIHPTLSGEQLERVLDCPLKVWGWDKQECIAAIHLADLPLPLTLTTA